MDVADYWSMAREYVIWNATIASLQFWIADLGHDYPWHHHRKSLFSILLHNINSYTTSAI